MYSFERLDNQRQILAKKIPPNSKIIVPDEASLAIASCMCMHDDYTLFLPRARDYGMDSIQLEDKRRLHGMKKDDKFHLISVNSTALESVKRTMGDAVNEAVLIKWPSGGAPKENREMNVKKDSKPVLPFNTFKTPFSPVDKGKLPQSLEHCPVISFGDYRYFVHPLSDAVPFIEAQLLREGVKEMEKMMEDCDVLLTAVFMGVPLGAPLSLITGIPLAVAIKQDGGKNYVKVRQDTGYFSGELFVPRLEEKTRVGLVDDVLSTCGTLRALTTAVTDMKATVEFSAFLFNKVENTGKIENELGFAVKRAFNTCVTKDGVEFFR